MSTPLLNPAALTQAYRDVMAHIQHIAATASLQGIYAVNVEYCGQTNQLEVRVYRRVDLKAYTFKAIKTFNVLLPGYAEQWHEDSSLCMASLQLTARELEALLLTPPTGDAA